MVKNLKNTTKMDKKWLKADNVVIQVSRPELQVQSIGMQLGLKDLIASGYAMLVCNCLSQTQLQECILDNVQLSLQAVESSRLAYKCL